MSDLLTHIYNACDPYEPATHEYYTDLAKARGSSALTQEFMGHLLRADDYLYFLFSGHIGSGKSSELNVLKHKLAHPTPGRPRYFPVLINVLDYLDDYDVALTDILLAIVTEVAYALRTEAGIELKDTYFAKRLEELKNYFLSDVEINKGEVPVLGGKLEVQRIKRDPTAREEVRKSLQPRLTTMIEEINLVIDQARVRLKQKAVGEGEEPYKDVVIILDNLERIQRFEGREGFLESQRELFLERHAQLKALQAHVIYTVPLRLVRSSEGPMLEQRYGNLFVLPMVKVTERGTRAVYLPGWECLQSLLVKRIGEQPLLEVFEPEALEFLLTYCGGHVRNLMTFIQNACAYADELPIALPDVHRAIQQSVRTYSTAIPEEHWPLLAGLDRSADQMIPGGVPAYLAMLENLSVLEYINGGCEEDPFTPAEPWYAVNPIVRQLTKFKQAVAEWERRKDERRDGDSD